MSKKISNLIFQYDDGVELSVVAEEAMEKQALIWLHKFVDEINEENANVVLFMSKIDGWHLSIETLNKDLEHKIYSYLQATYFRFPA